MISEEELEAKVVEVTVVAALERAEKRDGDATDMFISGFAAAVIEELADRVVRYKRRAVEAEDALKELLDRRGEGGDG